MAESSDMTPQSLMALLDGVRALLDSMKEGVRELLAMTPQELEEWHRESRDIVLRDVPSPDQDRVLANLDVLYQWALKQQ